MDQVRTRAAELQVPPERQAVEPHAPAGPPGGGGTARAVARIALWPLLRFFDPRFGAWPRRSKS
jgi:hypothetical protein